MTRISSLSSLLLLAAPLACANIEVPDAEGGGTPELPTFDETATGGADATGGGMSGDTGGTGGMPLIGGNTGGTPAATGGADGMGTGGGDTMGSGGSMAPAGDCPAATCGGMNPISGATCYTVTIGEYGGWQVDSGQDCQVMLDGAASSSGAALTPGTAHKIEISGCLNSYAALGCWE